MKMNLKSAIIAIILTTVLSVIIILYFHFFSPHKTWSMGPRIECKHHLKLIYQSLVSYSNDNEGEYPPYDGARGFNMLLQGGYLKKETLLCPLNKNYRRENNLQIPVKDADISYTYRGGYNIATDEDTVICWEKDINGDHINFLINEPHPIEIITPNR